MNGERYRPPAQERWKEEIIEEINRIKQLPDSILNKGGVFEVQTKTGEKLMCETYEVNLDDAIRAGTEGIKNPHVGNERLYLIAVNSSNEAVGTRFTTLFFDEDKIIAKSIIKVLHKGKGYASPIEEAFQQQLQTIADQKRMPVVWQVSNLNLENLEEYEQGENADPDITQEMKQEQQRWQVLYGPGNKLGIVNGKKVFTPRLEEKSGL